MAIKCPRCGAEYDVTLFEFGRTLRCDCGERVDLQTGHERKSDDGPSQKPLDRESNDEQAEK